MLSSRSSRRMRGSNQGYEMREEIIRMAREAGVDDWWDSGNEMRDVLQQHLEHFAELVAAAKKEECAKVVDPCCSVCAAAIRALP